MADSIEEVKIQWHPGFYGAAEIELIANKRDLEFLREYNLNKEPIRMDLLIIKKLSDVKIKNEIGHIFKKYNVIEYKSPDDELSIDDYYKTVGYEDRRALPRHILYQRAGTFRYADCGNRAVGQGKPPQFKGSVQKSH